MKEVFLLLCFLSVPYAAAVIGHTNQGMHFVVACPWSPLPCQAYITTQEQRVLVRISTNANIQRQHDSEQHYYVIRDSVLTIQIHQQSYSRLASSSSGSDSSNGIMAISNVIKSTGSIRILVMTQNDRTAFGDGFVLIPKASCGKSYYIATVRGNPFIAVLAFDDILTNVSVSIPPMTPALTTDCTKTLKCSSGETIHLLLAKYQVWYFKIKGFVFDLQDTVITADNPVYVVAGNSGLSPNGNTDLTISAMKSTVTWGKVYIIPHVVDAAKAFLAHSLQHPFTLKFYEKGKTSRLVTFRLHDDIYEYGQTSNTMAITADLPFGLYQIFLPNGTDAESKILNLIPVEQWIRGQVYVKTKYDTKRVNLKCILITETMKNGVILSGVMKRAVMWDDSSVTLNGTTYQVGEVSLEQVHGSVYIQTPYAKNMLYIFAFQKGLPFSNPISYPYQFYQGQIYQKQCQRSVIPILDDGIDNDCDGKLDEEIENGIDDDGDDLIDEDNASNHRDGHWSQWTFLCNMSCQNSHYVVKTRSCVEQSALGKPCNGESINCNGHACPSRCHGGNEAKTRPPDACYCHAGCQTCRRGVFQCDSCKPGYLPTKECTTWCPDGWAGLGCVQLIVDDPNGNSTDDNPNESEVMLNDIVMTAGFVIMVGLSFTVCLVHWKNKEWVEDEMQMEEMKIDLRALTKRPRRQKYAN